MNFYWQTPMANIRIQENGLGTAQTVSLTIRLITHLVQKHYQTSVNILQTRSFTEVGVRSDHNLLMMMM